MLRVEGLTYSRGTRRLFKDLTVTLAPGELLVVLGENGSGKTSLLRMLVGLSAVEEGNILWQGVPIQEVREQFSSQITYLGHLNGIKEDLTSLENLEFFARLGGVHGSPLDARAALHVAGLDRCADLPTRVLSQGQKRRVSLARLWMSQCPLWVLDEPFTALDDSAGRLLAQRLESHLLQEGMVILATHQEVPLAAGTVRRVSLPG